MQGKICGSIKEYLLVNTQALVVFFPEITRPIVTQVNSKLLVSRSKAPEVYSQNYYSKGILAGRLSLAETITVGPKFKEALQAYKDKSHRNVSGLAGKAGIDRRVIVRIMKEGQFTISKVNFEKICTAFFELTGQNLNLYIEHQDFAGFIQSLAIQKDPLLEKFEEINKLQTTFANQIISLEPSLGEKLKRAIKKNSYFNRFYDTPVNSAESSTFNKTTFENILEGKPMRLHNFSSLLKRLVMSGAHNCLEASAKEELNRMIQKITLTKEPPDFFNQSAEAISHFDFCIPKELRGEFLNSLDLLLVKLNKTFTGKIVHEIKTMLNLGSRHYTDIEKTPCFKVRRILCLIELLEKHADELQLSYAPKFKATNIKEKLQSFAYLDHLPKSVN